MTIKGPPIDSTQAGEVWDASAEVEEEVLMPSVCPRPLTTPALLVGAQHEKRLGNGVRPDPSPPRLGLTREIWLEGRARIVLA